MEIVLVWSWFSFIVGIVSALVGSFLLLLSVAFKNWKKQQKVAKTKLDNLDKMFSTWGGRDNSAL